MYYPESPVDVTLLTDHARPDVGTLTVMRRGVGAIKSNEILNHG